MAERTAVRSQFGGGRTLIVWSALANGDNGNMVELPPGQDVCVQFTGTGGTGGSISLKGTNAAAAAGSFADPILSDSAGNAITKATAAIPGLEQAVERPRFIYPHVTAGDVNTALVCSVLVTRYA